MDNTDSVGGVLVIGATAGFGSNLIHLLVVVALIVLVLNLLRGRRTLLT